jgi:hypothetical protein
MRGATFAGSHTSMLGVANVAGMTPTISKRRQPINSAWPIASGRRWKRRAQNPSLITAAPGPSTCSSSAVNTRPAMVDAPNTAKYRGVTRRPSSRSGSVALVSVTFSV